MVNTLLKSIQKEKNLTISHLVVSEQDVTLCNVYSVQWLCNVQCCNAPRRAELSREQLRGDLGRGESQECAQSQTQHSIIVISSLNIYKVYSELSI